MANFVQYATSVEALELVINEETGAVHASQRATARMCNCDEKTIRNKKAAEGWVLESAEIQTSGGLQGAELLNEDQIFDCLAKYNPTLLAQCAKAGLRVYLYGLAGYEIKATAKPDLPTDEVGWIEYALARKKEALANEQRALLAEQERDQERQAKELAEGMLVSAEEDIEALTEIVDELHNYSSIIRIAKYNGVDERAFKWQALKQVCKANNLEIKDAPCPRFGTKKLWPHDAWRIAYPGYKLPETVTLVIRP